MEHVASLERKKELLDQLKLEDTNVRSSHSLNPKLLGSFSVVVLAIVGVSLYFMFQNDVIPIEVAVAKDINQSVNPKNVSTLDASGYVIARRQATVSTKITGRVRDVLIEEGQFVNKNQVIARLDDTHADMFVKRADALLAQVSANLEATKSAFENADSIFFRHTKLFSDRIISPLDFENAKVAYDNSRNAVEIATKEMELAKVDLDVALLNFEDTIIRAPFSGVITEKAAQPGETVSPISAGGGFTRTGIGTIVDMDSLEVAVDVSENFINRVRSDQPVSIRLNAYPDWVIPGKVIAVIPTADQSKATVAVRISFNENDNRILPQMGVRVSFLENLEITSKEIITSAVIVPSDSVISNNGQFFVYVVGENRVEERTVRLGEKTSKGQIVLAGVHGGEKIAVGNIGRLKDQASVRIFFSH